jgi:hypothetical protein
MKKIILILLLGLGSFITNAKELEEIATKETIVTYNFYTCTVTATVYLYNQEGELIDSFSDTASYTSDSPFTCAIAQHSAEQGALNKAYGYISSIIN